MKANQGITTAVVFVAVVVGLFGRDFWMVRLYPYGLPKQGQQQQRSPPPLPTTKHKKNYDLTSKNGKLTKIFERGSKGLLRSPETILFGPDGTMYAMTDQGLLISMTDIRPSQKEDNGNDDDGIIWRAETNIVKDLGAGRPLGAKFTPDGSTLYICDAVLGLIRIRNLTTDPTSKVEVVASKIINSDGTTWTSINFADDLTIGPKTGRVYFTDASEVSSPRNVDLTVDVMYGSKIDSMRGPSGRLIQYDPATDELEVLADGLWFANGVGVDAEETYLVVAETFQLGLLKYHLSGEKAGTPEYIVEGDPLNAYVDGVDCAWPGVTVDSSSPAYCYAANPSEVVPAHSILWKLPPPLDWVARALLLLVPKEFAPHVDQYGGITVVDGATGKFISRIEDPTGEDINKITGITVHDNKLYLGSLENNFVGVYSLS